MRIFVSKNPELTDSLLLQNPELTEGREYALRKNRMEPHFGHFGRTKYQNQVKYF